MGETPGAPEPTFIDMSVMSACSVVDWSPQDSKVKGLLLYDSSVIISQLPSFKISYQIIAQNSFSQALFPLSKKMLFSVMVNVCWLSSITVPVFTAYLRWWLTLSPFCSLICNKLNVGMWKSINPTIPQKRAYMHLSRPYSRAFIKIIKE